MKFLSLFTIIALATACMNVKGTMDVKEHLVYKKNGKSQVLLAGTYNADLAIKGNDKIVLKLENSFESKKMRLQFPKGTVLPSTQGDFEVTATDLNQPFALKGNLKTDVTVGEVVDTFENCTVNEGPQYCGDYGRHGGGVQHCGPYTYPGTRHVKYKMVTTVKNLAVGFVQEGVEKASFKGKDVNEKRDYLYYGVCL